MTVSGIDISHYQGHVDWPAVPSTVAFAILKATQGARGVDPTFAANRFGAVKAGKRVGGYHFAGNDDPVVEADHFLATVGHVNAGDLPPVYDCEQGAGNLVDQALAWLQQVEHHTGRIPFLYSYKPFIQAHLSGDKRLARYPLYIAAYGSVPPHVDGWPTWTIWQRTSSGTVPGIAGRVDMDVFNGDQAAFNVVCGIHPGIGGSGHKQIGAFVVDPDVVVWKTLLNDHASMHLHVDDHFDAAAVDATKAFQTIARLPVTGIVNDATWAAGLALTK